MKFKYIIITDDCDFYGTDSKEKADKEAEQCFVVDCEAGTLAYVGSASGGVELEEIESLDVEDQSTLELEDEDDGERTDLTGEDL